MVQFKVTYFQKNFRSEKMFGSINLSNRSEWMERREDVSETRTGSEG